MNENNFDLIITIVNKGHSSEVINAAKTARAEGGTVINGRGSGIHEVAKLFGFLMEPEKEIILTLVDANKTEQVLQAISDKVGINKPGKGIAFVIDVKRAVGISHYLNN
ncbi:P-II family nitrogen regulator [Proteiniborus sp. MB09-C3]|uniref:P-II family nitrogen regulator n=1 Tax=Proteiniborus sp. MB09-C3 TaxID=3050072 RepID=UPI0025579F15|nr:P-II family nitrogen regulator [Proteiniborus sp. MB09-C3]WIV12660.1 P-II family nitrogen regulator [Proteiniborus sp. MB09-C3]